MSIQITQLGGDDNCYYGAAICHASNGNIFVLDISMEAFGYHYLCIYKSTDGGQSFTRVQHVSEGSLLSDITDYIFGLDAAIDGNDVIHILAYSDDHLIYNTYNTTNNTFSSSNPWPEISGINSMWHKMMLDSDGKVHCVFTDYSAPNYRCRYTNNVSGSWLSPETVYSSTTRFWSCDINVKSTSIIEVSWGGGYDFTLVGYHRRTRTGGVWGDTTNYTHSGNRGPHSQLVSYNSATAFLTDKNYDTDAYNDIWLNDVELPFDTYDASSIDWNTAIGLDTNGLLTVFYNVWSGSTNRLVCRYGPLDGSGGWSDPITIIDGDLYSWLCVEFDISFVNYGNTINVLCQNDSFGPLTLIVLELNHTTSSKSAYLAGACTPEIEWVALSFEDPKSYETSSIPAYLKPIDSQAVSHSAYAHGKLTSSGSKPAYLLGQGALQMPSADVAVNSWVNETSGTTLYPSINEVNFDDSNFVTEANVQVNDYFEVSVADLGVGYVATGDQYIEIRGWSVIGSITLQLALRRGGANLVTRSQTFPGDATSYSFQLTPQEIDLIGDDYNSMSIRITVTGIS